MKNSAVNFDMVDASSSRFDKTIEWLLISLLAFAPFALGAVQAWSEQVVLALAAAISVCFLLKLVVDRDARFAWSWLYVPLVLFVLLVTVQLIPLPTGIVEAISPNTAAVKKDLLGDLPNSNDALASMTISFYPHATKHDLRIILAVAAVFIVVVNVLRRPEQVKRLLTAIAIIGGCVAALALVQDVFGNGKIYWLVDPGVGKACSGPFVNHSHYGQFMNLSIGAALGLLLVRVHQAFTGMKVTPAAVFDYLGSPAARVIWLLVAVIIVGAATVFVSLTRGGMISMLIGAGFTTLVLSSRQSLKGQGWIIALLALGAFICVLYIGFDAVYDRLASLRELHQAQAGRWQIVKDVSLAWARFPVFGTGQGTHEVVYPMFDRSTTPALAAYAENEYAQAAEETGVIGLATLLCFGILVWTCYVRNIRSTSMPIRSAAYGLGFGLAAIMVHSLSDFGQHLPANAMLSAVSCALLLSLSRIGQKSDPLGGAVEATRGSRILRVAVLICVSGAWAFILLGANNARLAEASWRKALAAEYRIMAEDWQASDEEYVGLISNAAEAAAYQPDNVKYQHWLNVYRWKAMSRATDPNTGTVVIPEYAMEFVRHIVSELHNTRLLCPTYGATYCIVGQLEEFVLGDPAGADHIRKGFELAPCDPVACFVAGLLDAEEQHFDASFKKFTRAIALDGRFFRAVCDVYVNHVNRPDLAVAIAGDDIARLSHVANALGGREEHRDIVEKARARVVELLKEQCSTADAPASAFAFLASIYTREKDNEAAMEYYRRALALDYGQVQWRFALAQLLAEANRIPDAINQARICLRLRPQFKAAERLIANLSVSPGTVKDGNPTQ
jgi:tetratricopeptide (TPR) repeat protein